MFIGFKLVSVVANLNDMQLLERVDLHSALHVDLHSALHVDL